MLVELKGNEDYKFEESNLPMYFDYLDSFEEIHQNDGYSGKQRDLAPDAYNAVVTKQTDGVDGDSQNE